VDKYWGFVQKVETVPARSFETVCNPMSLENWIIIITYK
jgi:hypothetical protein